MQSPTTAPVGIPIPATATKRKCTKACDSCKRRKRRCSGDQPCVYCITVKKADTCTYTSDTVKRGPKKRASEPTTIPATNSNTINSTTDNDTDTADGPEEEEPIMTAGVRRGLAAAVADVDADVPDRVVMENKIYIQQFIVANGLLGIVEFETMRSRVTHEQRVQLYSFLACTARHNNNVARADFYMKLVINSLKEIYEECTIEAGLAFICAAQYYPLYSTKSKFYLNHAWSLAKNVPIVTKRDRMVKMTIFMMHQLSDNTSPISERATVATNYFNSLHVDDSELDSDSAAMFQLGNFFKHIVARLDITDPQNVMSSIPKAKYSLEERNSMLMDYKLLNRTIAHEHTWSFMLMYFKILKLFVDWKSGLVDVAQAEATSVVTWLDNNHSAVIMFYADVVPLAMLYAFCKENDESLAYKVACHIQLVYVRTASNPHFSFYEDLLKPLLSNHPNLPPPPTINHSLGALPSNTNIHFNNNNNNSNNNTNLSETTYQHTTSHYTEHQHQQHQQQHQHQHQLEPPLFTYMVPSSLPSLSSLTRSPRHHSRSSSPVPLSPIPTSPFNMFLTQQKRISVEFNDQAILNEESSSWFENILFTNFVSNNNNNN